MKKKFFYLATIIIAVALAAVSCDQHEDAKKPPEKKEPELTQAQKDSIECEKLRAKYDVFPKINYRREVIDDWKEYTELRSKYARADDKFSLKTLKTMNRMEWRYFNVGDTIVVPDTLIDDMRAYSCFPQYYCGAKDIPKLILVSNKMQCYACYENGVQVRFAAANTGKERTPTFPGRYSLVWKERVRRSSLDSNWVMPYTWNFHRLAGNALHQFTMPGRPVSHSCVRQFLDDAEWLYNWGEKAKYDSNKRIIEHSGTPVIILDIFDFSRKTFGPWIDIKSNKEGILELPENPMEVEEALIPWCQMPKTSRGLIPKEDKNRFLYAEDTLRARGIIREHVRLIHTRNFNDERRKKAAAEAAKEAAEKQKQLEEEMNGADSTGSEKPPTDTSGSVLPEASSPEENPETLPDSIPD